jgi:hypothetical protein
MRSCLLLRAFVAALVLSACGGMNAQEYFDLVEEARPCAAGDTCVLAGVSACTCATPVNASQEEEITEAADDFDCEKVETSDRCSAHTNVRCEAGRCISDESP